MSTQTPGPVDYMLNAYDLTGKSMPPAQLLAAYTRGPADLEAALANLTSAQLRAQPTTENVGKWTILQVVGHLADCEQFLAERMKRTIAYGAAGERPLLLNVDENKYIAAFDYNTRDLPEELALIHATRNQMSRLLRALPEPPHPAWSRPAIHTEAGLMTLHQIVFHATNHIIHHLKFIKAKRAAFEKE